MKTEIPYEDSLNKELDDTIFKRKLILWLTYKKNFNPNKVEEFTSIKIQTIYSFLKKWSQTGIVKDLDRTGRPKFLSEKHENLIIQKQMDDRFKPVKTIFNEIKQSKELGKKEEELTYWHVWSIINKSFETTNALYKIKLSEQNKLKRLDFIEKIKKFRKNKFEKIIWTDEKVFKFSPQNKKLKVKLLIGEDKSDFTLPMKQMGGGSVMFWGAISASQKIHLSVLEGKFNSQLFANFLKEEAIPAIEKKVGKDYIFQQDNAPTHKGVALEYLKKSKIQILEWPPQSPDMNPIEKVWMWMANKVGLIQFKNRKEVISYVFDLWENLPNEIVQSFTSHLPTVYKWIEGKDGEIFMS